MADDELDAAVDINELSIEEKIKRLSEADKEYLRGYIDRALEAQQKPAVTPKKQADADN
jgi:hypothetical protein